MYMQIAPSDPQAEYDGKQAYVQEVTWPSQASVLVVLVPYLLLNLWLYSSAIRVKVGKLHMTTHTHNHTATFVYLITYARFMPTHTYVHRHQTQHIPTCRLQKMRACAQVREALQMYENSRRLKVPESPKKFVHLAAEYEIPACRLISVLREGEWRRLPFNLVVTGDLFKLRIGEIFPCDAIGVKLVSVARKVMLTQCPCSVIRADVWMHNLQGDNSGKGSTIAMPDSYEVVFDESKWQRGGTYVAPSYSAVPPLVRVGTFVALGTPSVGQVRRFLELSMDVRKDSRFENPFLDRAEAFYCNSVRPWSLVLAATTTIILLLRYLWSVHIHSITSA